MDFYEAVRRRRMVRNYSDEPVDPRALDRIVAAARKAPSAGFSQGQSMIVVTDPESRRRIADSVGEADYVARGFDPWISRAPVHVVVCVREEAYHERYREPDKAPDGVENPWPVPFWWVDAGATMMLLLLAAAAEGLAAGFLGGPALEGIGDLLSIPDDVSVVGIVTIGHGAPDRRSGSLQRGWKPAGEVIHRERWRSG